MKTQAGQLDRERTGAMAKTITTVDALRALLAEHPGRVFVRWSAGCRQDRRQQRRHGGSFDCRDRVYHQGMSAVRVDPDWLEDDTYLRRRMSEYRGLALVYGYRCWLLVADQMSVDSDGYETVDALTATYYAVGESLCRWTPLDMAASYLSRHNYVPAELRQKAADELGLNTVPATPNDWRRALKTYYET